MRSPLHHGGRGRFLVIGATLGIVVAMTGAPAASSSPSSQASASMVIEKVDGIFRGYPGDCPDDLPATPLTCHEWDLTVFKAGGTYSDGGVAPPKTPWILIALHHTLTFPGDFGEPVESDAVNGYAEGVDVTFDRQHLSLATLRAPDLHLGDGSIVDLEATWTAVGDRQLYGNDGPSLEEFGLVKQLHTDCFTTVSQGHQKFRSAHVRAVIDGAESRYDGIYAYIAFNQFLTVTVVPANCR
jgi:hypothetical protein